MIDCRSRPLVLAVVGPTATGKSALALELADELNAEIVSVDSVQVYRGMDIGSDKPSKADQTRVPHHMIDILESDEETDAEMFRSRAHEVILEIASRRKIPLLVGGSALYFTAVTAPVDFKPTNAELRAQIEAKLEAEGLGAIVVDLQRVDPGAARRIDLKNPRRVVRALESALLMTDQSSGTKAPSASTSPSARQAGSSDLGAGPAALTETTTHGFPVNLLGLALAADATEHAERIRNRVRSMLDRGLEAEVRDLFGFDGGAAPQPSTAPSRTARQALGYKEVAAALSEGQSGDSAIDEIVSRTRQLSRRQTAWFRRDARLCWVSISRISPSGLLDAAHSYFDSRLRAIGKECSA